MNWFKRLSVAHKIRVLLIGAAAAALLTAVGLLAVLEGRTFREQLVSRISTIAAITAENAIAVTGFEDRAGAAKLLTSLRSEPSIRDAAIVTMKGAVLAERLEGPQVSAFNTLAAVDLSRTSARFDGSYLYVDAPIRLEDETLGFLRVRASLSDLYATLATYCWIAIAITLVSLGI